MTDRYLDVHEWVAALKHMKDPIVLVEGDDDVQICRWAGDCASSRRLDIHPAGGKQTLLAVYERRSEFTHIAVVFVADRDLWLFSGIPQGYDNVVWTEGYSIENDLYAGANLEDLLNADEIALHRESLESLIEWYAFEVEEYLEGREAQIDKHYNQIIRQGETKVNQNLLNSRSFRPPNEELHQQIKDAYQLQLRGKWLFQMLFRFLTARGRGTKYNIRTLHENAVKLTSSHALMNQLIGEIEQKIAEHAPPN